MEDLSMLKHTKFILFFIALTVFGITSCSKKDSGNAPAPKTTLSITGGTDVIVVPQSLSNSDNTMAQLLSSYITTATNMSSFISYFTPPEDATRSNLKSSGVTYTWTSPFYGGQPMTFYWTYYDSVDKNKWTIDISFRDKTYRYAEATELKDHSQGNIKFNYNWTEELDGNSSDDLFWIYSWTKKESGPNSLEYTIQASSGDNSTTDISEQQVIVQNPDLSGELTFYEDGMKYQVFNWSADGNGSWKTFENGEVVDSGTW